MGGGGGGGGGRERRKRSKVDCCSTLNQGKPAQRTSASKEIVVIYLEYTLPLSFKNKCELFHLAFPAVRLFDNLTETATQPSRVHCFPLDLRGCVKNFYFHVRFDNDMRAEAQLNAALSEILDVATHKTHYSTD